MQVVSHVESAEGFYQPLVRSLLCWGIHELGEAAVSAERARMLESGRRMDPEIYHDF